MYRENRGLRRYRRHRNPALMGGLEGAFKETFSKQMLMTAGGAVAASFGTGYVLNKWGASLPLASNNYGKLIYVLGLPVVAAGLLRKKSPDLAQGLIIGGLVMTVNSLMQSFKGTSAAAPATVSRFAVAGQLGNRNLFAAYPQAMVNPAAALGGRSAAFAPSAW